MKKQILMLFAVLLAIAPAMSQSYDFSDTAPTGQTLYYKIVNGGAQIVPENNASPYYTTYPSGNLVIPETVSHGNRSYYVRAIGDRAFMDCSGLNSVSISNSVKSIGYSAFFIVQI